MSRRNGFIIQSQNSVYPDREFSQVYGNSCRPPGADWADFELGFCVVIFLRTALKCGTTACEMNLLPEAQSDNVALELGLCVVIFLRTALKCKTP